MKKFIYLLLITITVASCGNKEGSVDSLIENGNLSEIKAKKVVVEITVSANNVICAKGTVIAVKMPDSMSPT